MMLEIHARAWDKHTHLSVLSYRQKQIDTDNTHVHGDTFAWAGT
jgi:hypothetical protein